MSKDFYRFSDSFKGLHLSDSGESELEGGESPYMKNFSVIDGYKMKKREGTKLLFSPEGKFRGLWCGALENVEVFAAIFGKLLYDKGGNAVGEIEGEEECSFVVFEQKLYILTGSQIKVFDGRVLESLKPYRPLIAIATPPDGGGRSFEGVNLLTGAVRQSFSPDGQKDTFKLALNNIDSIDYVKIAGEYTEKYTYDLSLGTVTISDSLPTVPDSVEIGFTKNTAENSERITKCRFGTVYGGDNDTRIFLWGNPDYPSFRFFSEPAEGVARFDYFPENNYTSVGDKDKITSIIRQYDRQLIFTASKAYVSYANEDDTGRFPIYPLNSQKGCTAERFACLADNIPLTLCEDGIYKWVSTTIRDERNAVRISDRIDKALAGKENIRGFDRESTGEFYIYFDDKIYIYNYRLDVFYYYENICARQFSEYGGKLYFANDNGLFVFGGDDDCGEKIEAVWHSHYNDFSYRGQPKSIFSVELDIKSERSSRFKVAYAADNSSREECDFVCGVRALDFADLNFADFGFNTGVAAIHFKRRLHIKRCRAFKLIITNDEMYSGVHIVSMGIKGRVYPENYF